MPDKSAVLPPKNQERARAKMQIVEYLRGQIVGGELSSTARLPTQRELREQFGTSKMTVEHAFEILAREGFISGAGARGTFVAEYPPHTSRYALAFPGTQDEVGSSPFWTRLSEEAVKAEDSYNYRVSLFYEVNPTQDSADYLRLLYEIRTHQLAGLIFAADPNYIANATFIEALDIPVAAISTEATECFAPLVQLSYDSFFDRSLDYVAQSGKKRVAVFAPPLTEAHQQYFSQGVVARELTTFPYWWLAVPFSAPATARAFVQLLMNQHHTLRPDALIIADDTFIEPALQGMRDAGVRIPQDMEIVALSNFPATAMPAAAMQRVGYSVPQVLQSCLDLIRSQRSLQPVPPHTVIEAITEDEVAQHPPS